MTTDNIKLAVIDIENINIFECLVQCYEAEFSNLTLKMPNEHGLFHVEVSPLIPPYIGYLLYQQEIPIGFCVANIESNVKDIAEFYIIPAMRKKNMGYQLAVNIFKKHPGKWQVRQIENAIGATNFWRSMIKKYTQNNFEESVIGDERWGIVTCQRFETPLMTE